MNPEFQRNLWLNLSTGRLIMMPTVLCAIFFAAALVPGLNVVREAGEALFVLIVVFWGTWLASRAVVGEIRDRTWDNQRMSSISPWSMVWGKLFGSTVYVWYGGAICLVAVAWARVQAGQADKIVPDIAFWVSIGLFSHAISMLASLLAVRRQSRHLRLEVFAYQIAGLLAAQFAASLWPGRLVEDGIGDITWFGLTMAAEQFFLLSLAAFILWAIVGNQRLMRQELQFRNWPVVWIAFLLFMMAWVAGWVNAEGKLDATAVLTARVYAAGFVASALTYAMIFLDTKDPVLLRWIGARVKSGRLFSAFGRMPSWMWSLAAVGIVLVTIFLLPDPLDLAARLDPNNPAGLSEEGVREAFREASLKGIDPRVLVSAAFLFLVRDVFIVLAYNAGPAAGSGRRRGDFAALVTLVVLYVIIPSILMGLKVEDALVAVVPYPTQPALLAIVPPAVEAVLVALIAFGRMATVHRPAHA